MTAPNAHTAFLQSAEQSRPDGAFATFFSKEITAGVTLEAALDSRASVLIWEKMAEAAQIDDFEQARRYFNCPVLGTMELLDKNKSIRTSMVTLYDEDQKMRIHIRNFSLRFSGEIESSFQELDLEFHASGNLHQFRLSGYIDSMRALRAKQANRVTHDQSYAQWDERYHNNAEGHGLLTSKDEVLAALKAFVLDSVKGMYEGKTPDFSVLNGLTHVNLYKPEDIDAQVASLEAKNPAPTAPRV